MTVSSIPVPRAYRETPSRELVITRAYLAEAVLLIFALLTLGVLTPQLHVTNFDKLTVTEAVSEISTADPYNQLRWVGLAAVATLAALIYGLGRLLRLTFRIWPLLLLFGYCAVSAAWSDYPMVTLRRSLGLIVPAYCLVVAIAYVDDARRAALIFYAAFWMALLLHLAVIPLPVAFDEFGFFRGAAGNKNTLGSIAALAILYGLAIGPWLKGGPSKALNLLYLVGWLGVLAISVSKTSMALVVAVPVLFAILLVLSGALRLGFVSSAVGTLALVAVTVGLASYGLGYRVDEFAADPTFNGRTPIWAFMFHEIGKHWLLGAGCGSFWGIGYEAANLASIYNYIQLLNQAHNGYLDVLAALGVIGFILVVATYFYFALAAEDLRWRDRAWFRLVWFLLLFSLLHNTMESSVLVPFNTVWHMTLLAWLLAVWRPEGDQRWRH